VNGEVPTNNKTDTTLNRDKPVNAGDYVRYGAAEGFVISRPKGLFVVDIKGNNDIFIEGGESGQSARAIGITKLNPPRSSGVLSKQPTARPTVQIVQNNKVVSNPQAINAGKLLDENVANLRQSIDENSTTMRGFTDAVELLELEYGSEAAGYILTQIETKLRADTSELLHNNNKTRAKIVKEIEDAINKQYRPFQIATKNSTRNNDNAKRATTENSATPAGYPAREETKNALLKTGLLSPVKVAKPPTPAPTFGAARTFESITAELPAKSEQELTALLSELNKPNGLADVQATFTGGTTKFENRIAKLEDAIYKSLEKIDPLRYSESPITTAGSSVERVNNILAKLGEQLTGNKGNAGAFWENVAVVTKAELSPEIPKTARAYYDASTGKIALIADRLLSREVTPVLMHELVHKFGVEALGGDANVNIVLNALASWETAPLGSLERTIFDVADAKAKAASKGSNIQELKQRYSEELLSYAVEETIRQGVQPDSQAAEGTAPSWLNRIKTAFESWLGKWMGGAKVSLTPKQLATLGYYMAGKGISNTMLGFKYPPMVIEANRSDGAFNKSAAAYQNEDGSFDVNIPDIGTKHVANDMELRTLFREAGYTIIGRGYKVLAPAPNKQYSINHDAASYTGKRVEAVANAVESKLGTRAGEATRKALTMAVEWLDLAMLISGGKNARAALIDRRAGFNAQSEGSLTNTLKNMDAQIKSQLEVSGKLIGATHLYDRVTEVEDLLKANGLNVTQGGELSKALLTIALTENKTAYNKITGEPIENPVQFKFSGLSGLPAAKAYLADTSINPNNTAENLRQQPHD
jgi:hypothetical protein